MTHAETHREPTGMEVAVIGMAGRFPGARNVREYWDNLLAGRESIRHLTDEELDALGVPPAVYRRPGYVRAVRSMDDMDLFDAAFFDVSPREAELLDPQHRMFLEQCWETLEDAGYDPDRYRGAVGVFAGSRMNSYMLGFLSHMLGPGAIQTQVANDKDYLATRVSYKLDLGGPSVTVQTACSTALVALHMACQSLIGGECDMALAGGMSGRTIEKGYPYREGDVGSPDGRIYAFDARAKGTIFGNGSGVMLLKRLEEALEDGDDVRAVILGSALSNDGSRKVGFTAPSVDGQARAIRAALSVSDVHPESISYVEAHGTGTPLGDPIEIQALTRAWREHTDRTGFCRIGQVQHRPPVLRRRCGVVDQADPGAAEPAHPAVHQLRAAQPGDRLRRQPLPGGHRGDGLGAAGRHPPGRGVRLRHGGHQRSRDLGGGAGEEAVGAPPASVAVAAPVGPDRRSAPGRHGAPGGAPGGPLRDLLGRRRLHPGRGP